MRSPKLGEGGDPEKQTGDVQIEIGSSELLAMLPPLD
jgi:hypothetical protein